MTPVVTYFCIALLAFGFFALGKILSAHVQRLRARTLLLLALVPLALPWLLGMAYYTHLLDRPWYYEWRAQRMTDFLMALFALPLALALAWWGSHKPSRGALGRLLRGPLLTVACVMAVFAKPMLLPLHLDPSAGRWRDDVCLQSAVASCGPCATATVLRAMGVHVEEAQLGKEAQTSWTGTLNWLLLRALRDAHMEATFIEPRNLADIVPPAVIGVRLRNSGAGHFVAYLGRTSKGSVIGDPLEGRLELDEREFDEKYQFRHFALKISR